MCQRDSALSRIGLAGGEGSEDRVGDIGEAKEEKLDEGRSTGGGARLQAEDFSGSFSSWSADSSPDLMASA